MRTSIRAPGFRALCAATAGLPVIRVFVIGALVIGLTVAGVLAASFPAEAQDRARTRITVQPKSYLDPGTVVKPGTARYHFYAFPPQSNYARYGTGSYFGPSNQGDFGAGDGRWPLPGLFELPGY